MILIGLFTVLYLKCHQASIELNKEQSQTLNNKAASLNWTLFSIKLKKWSCVGLMAILKQVLTQLFSEFKLCWSTHPPIWNTSSFVWTIQIPLIPQCGTPQALFELFRVHSSPNVEHLKICLDSSKYIQTTMRNASM